jgi:hypothetical protein
MNRRDAREIDALARQHNRADGPDPRGCLAALVIGLACWVVLFAAAARLYRWWWA